MKHLHAKQHSVDTGVPLLYTSCQISIIFYKGQTQTWPFVIILTQTHKQKKTFLISFLCWNQEAQHKTQKMSYSGAAILMDYSTYPDDLKKKNQGGPVGGA